jgi:tetratricopeptide (TPR) repeat protein
VVRTAALLAAWLVVSGAAIDAGAGQRGGSASSALIDVPYVSQSELLCGGAAAAMLARHAGARGIYAEDFAALVDASAGGIRAGALAGALRERGYDVHTGSGSAAEVRGYLAGGRPVMVLLEDRPGRYHYVIVVGWSDGAVVYHDPARAPFMTSTEDAFDRAWAAARRWLLVLERASEHAPDRGMSVAPVAEPERPPLAEPSSPAMRLFVERRYQESAEAAEHLVARDPGDRQAWRLLGAARYLAGDPDRALEAWNRAHEPRLDLLRFDGLVRTPHRAVERLAGLSPDTLLTRESLVRADRRIALLPARHASRVTYVALPGGLAEVRGGIVEQTRYPSRLQWTIEAVRLPLDREVTVPIANLANAGDRLALSWRFWEGRPRASLDLQTPIAGTAGIWEVGGSWQQETYSGDEAPHERRLGRVGWTDWISARTRLRAGAGVARWDDRGSVAWLDGGVELRPLGDRVAMDVDLTSGLGARGFARGGATTRWRGDLSPRARVLGSAVLTVASRDTPLDLWPGAGTGQARTPLLRAHPLLQRGAIAGDAFGRTLAQATVETQRDVYTRGLLTVGAAAFVDTARAWRRLDDTRSMLHVDAGVGLRVRLAPGLPTIRIDVARGLRDGEVAVSAGIVAANRASRDR